MVNRLEKVRQHLLRLPCQHTITPRAHRWQVYASMLTRAIKSAWLMLDEMECQWVQVQYSWRLNERHYGGLQAMPPVTVMQRTVAGCRRATSG